MRTKHLKSIAVILALPFFLMAQEAPNDRPPELEVLKGSVGVWDAEIVVWPKGPDSSSITFHGVEKIRPYGDFWIASDFDSEYMGQTVSVHSIVGYDLDQEKLAGTVIDHGPYAATMSGTYDAASGTVTWITRAKTPDGKPMLQRSTVTQESPNKRQLVLLVPGKGENELIKFMQITYVKRK